jgi:hypothetical protein
VADITAGECRYGRWMEGPVGALSHDGWWMWDGARWVSAVSPDGRWRWNGCSWVPSTTARRALWQPVWRRSDSVAVAGWLLAVPCVLALVIVAVARLGYLTPTGVFVAVVVAYGVWAFIGGAVVRTRGRWWEILLVAAALIAFIGLVDMILFAIAAAIGPNHAGDDDGVAAGLAILVFVVYPPTLLPVALGRAMRRGLARLRSTAQ